MNPEQLVKDINRELCEIVWYPDNKEKQLKALARIEFLVFTAQMELSEVLTTEEKESNESDSN